MAENKLLELSNAFVKIAVAPNAGASLAYFKVKSNEKEIDVFRPATDKSIADDEAAGSAMYPMLPFVNAIHDGSFVYYGIKRSVPNNAPGHKEPFDGDGWRHAWKVKSQSEKSVELTFSGDPKKGFPFPYEAKITYTLRDKGFSVHIVLTNLGILPMPCAMGVRPFLPKTKDVVVKFRNKNVWEHMGTPLRDKPYTISPEWDFSEGKLIQGMSFDTCFGGFDGKAEITWPTTGINLKINSFEEFNHVILIVPENKNVFSVEPVTSAIDVFNLASRGIMGAGMKSIGPGEMIEATVEFDAESV